MTRPKRTSAVRRSFVNIALALVCFCNAYRVLPLLHRDQPLSLAAIRAFQILVEVFQGGLALTLAFAQPDATAFEFPSLSSLAPLATSFTAGRGFMLSEVLRLLFHASLSWYPLEALDAHSCHPPRVNILMQQAAVTARTAILGIPIEKCMQSWLLLPLYCYLDWRYASLNAIPGNATLLGYLSRRGALMLVSKLFFSGIPALIMMQNNVAQQVAVYGFCLPLLAVQCLVSGIRVFNGIDNVGLWEVWVATVVAFGVGTDVGYVLEELRAQFSKVRMIADDILPHHVVDTLMQQIEEDMALDEPAGHQPRQSRRSDASHASAAPSLELLRPPQVNATAPSGRRSSISMYRSAAVPPSHITPLSPRRSIQSPSDQTCRARSCSLDQVPELPGSYLRMPSKRRTQPSEATDVAEYAEEHPGACVLFADVCGFTTISEGTTPGIIVNMLNELFSKFDEIISESPYLYKLDVIGDCYMVASGLLWHDGDPCPARTLTDFAKLMLKTAASVLDPVTLRPLSMRCGIHQGPVVGALLGRVRRKYSLFGDVVNAASRLESTSRPGAIHVSAAIYSQLTGSRDPVVGYISAKDQETDLMGDMPLMVNKEFRTPGQALLMSSWKCLPPSNSSSLSSATDSTGSCSSGGYSRSETSGSMSSTGSYGMYRRLSSMMRDVVEVPEDAILAHRGAFKRRASKEEERYGEPDHLIRMLREARRAPCVVGSAEQHLLVASGSEEAWTHRGRIELKGRAALDSYLLQVM